MYGTLLRFRLRRDRIQLLVWALVLFLMMYAIVADVHTTFGSDVERANTLKLLMTTPAVLMLRGRPQGLSEGDFVTTTGLTFIAVLVGLMSTFLVVRHTRAEEERGQTETISATGAGRLTPTLTVVTMAVLANLMAVIVIVLACLAGGLPATGSWLLAASCGMVGLVFAGVAFLFAQIMPTSRSANAWSATLVIVSYFVRGVGDAAGAPHPATYTLTPAWPSWLSPIGWAQAALPFEPNRTWPLFVGAAVFLVLTAAALAIQDVRDVGDGVLAERSGRRGGSFALRGPFGLSARLQRGTLAAWIVSVVALAALLGGLSGVIVTQLSQAGPGVANAITEIGGARGTVIDAFANLGAIFSGLLAAAICVQGTMRLRQEEAAATADSVLATAVGRTRWMLSYLLVAAGGAVASLLLGGLVAGAAAGGKGGGFALWFGAIVWQIPGVLLFLGIVAAVFAVLPEATVAVGWIVYAASGFLGIFGSLVGLPGWAQKLSPLAHAPAVALPDPSYTGGWVMALVAVMLTAAAVLLFRTRDTKPVA